MTFDGVGFGGRIAVFVEFMDGFGSPVLPTEGDPVPVPDGMAVEFAGYGG